MSRMSSGKPVETLTDSSQIPTWRWKRFFGCDETAELIAQNWSDSEAPLMAEELKRGCVWAIGDVVIKTGSARRLRRSAESWKRLDPIPAPEPLMLGTCGSRGILLMRRCPGVTLERAWDLETARKELALLVADLLRRRIIHGDLSPNNLIWDGCRLWLIDLDGLRSAFHGIFWRHHLVRTWAWLFRRMPNGEFVRQAHDLCCVALGVTDLDKHWQLVMRAECRIAVRLMKKQKRRLVPVGHQKDGATPAVNPGRSAMSST